MPDSSHPSRDADEPRIAAVLKQVHSRWLAGEDLPDEQICAAHPDLMPALGERLRDLRDIRRARRAIERLSPGASSSRSEGRSRRPVHMPPVPGEVPSKQQARVSRSESQSGQGQALPSQVDLSSAPLANLTDLDDELDRLGAEPQADSIPGYTIIREIHRGGQGVVYEAVQLSTKRTVAVKVLLEGPFAGERAKWRFEREVKLIAALRHPNIVSIHDSGIIYGRYYFAMDYVRGEPLDTHVRLAAAPVRSAVGLLAQVLQAVAYAHRRGVIHRDLKPSNILVGEDGIPLVLDFGLAKIVGEELKDSRPGLVSMPGHLMGTLRYMSPEQTLGNPDDVDVRSDVYSLGVVLYELLTGQPPYVTSGDLAQTLHNIREADALRPSKWRREIDRDLEAIVLRAMAKEPDRRYQSAGEFADDLRAWLEGLPVSAKSASSLYVLRKLAARHYFHTAVIGALVAAVIGFGAISYQAYLRSDSALQEKTLSEQSLKGALQDMSRFKTEAVDLIRQQALGWFLVEWRADRSAQARAIRDQIEDRGCAEYLLMSFLLDDGISAEDLRGRLTPEDSSLLHFVIGERHAKAGNTVEAAAEFETAVHEAKDRRAWYVQSASGQLNQLRHPSTGPAAGPSSRPEKGSGAP